MGPNIDSSFLVRESLEDQINDALAELAFAKLCNAVWNGNPFRGFGPGGEDVYILSIGTSDPRQLVVNTQLKDSNIVVLAIVDSPRVEFVGWLTVLETKKKGSVVTNAQRQNTCSVAAESLRPMEQLIGELH